MSTILLTAFEAFGGDDINPALLAVSKINDPDVVKLFLPVEYETASRLLAIRIDALKPDAVICIGQAGGRTAVTPELYGVNLRSAKSPDNTGRICDGEKIVEGGPNKLETSFNARAIADALAASGIPSQVSESAGTYVCNDVLYSLMYKLQNTQIPRGFIHVPFCLEQIKKHPGAFALPLEDIIKAIHIAVDYVRMQLKG